MSPPLFNSRSTGRGNADSAELPLLDKLIDGEPDQVRDRPVTAGESLVRLQQAVQRDVEALLNARRPWRSLPAGMTALGVSPLGYGLTDFTAGAFNERQQLEALRQDIDETIRRFEPRLASVQVSLQDDGSRLRTTLRLRIDAMLRLQPAPEPIAFDTAVDITTADVTVHPSRVA